MRMNKILNKNVHNPVLIAVSFLFMTFSLPTSSESKFGIVYGEKLENLCLSDNEFDRGQCTGYIAAILAMKYGELSQAEIQCFATELLVLRNVAIHGWDEIQNLLLWVDDQLSEGVEPTESERLSINRSKKLASEVVDRKELLSRIRSGNPPLLSRPCLIKNRGQ